MLNVNKTIAVREHIFLFLTPGIEQLYKYLIGK